MKEKMNEMIDTILSILDRDERITSLKRQKQKLMQDEYLLTQLQKLRALDSYSDEYKKLKQQLFQNPDFVKFKQLENEIDFLILEINQKLKSLTEERSCNHENY